MNPVPPNPAQTAAIADYLAARDALLAQDAPSLLLPQAVIAFAHGRYRGDRSAITEHLAAQPSARVVYRQALAAARIAHSPLQACAQSHGVIQSRRGDHFTLHFRDSRAEADQVYVTLELHPSLRLADGVAVEVHAIGAQQVLTVRFPPLVDRRSQHLFLRDDAVLRLLQDDSAELEVIAP